jgi:O-antigen/teichoic acid export membrane protein
VLARLATTVPAAALVALAAAPLCDVFGLGPRQAEMRLWAFAGALIFFQQFLMVMLETLLMQRVTKWLLALHAVMRVGGFAGLMLLGTPTLMGVVYLEGAAHAVTGFLALAALARVLAAGGEGDAPGRLRAAPDRPGEALLPRAVRYGAYSWLRTVVQLLGARAVDKLVVARFMPGAATASFGFAERLHGMAERHSPLFLFWNVVSPALMARYADDGDAEELGRVCGALFKVNMLVVGPLLAAAVLLGDVFTGLVSKGKYPDAGWMLALLLCLLVVRSHHQILFALCNATERTRDLFVANIWPAVSLIPGAGAAWAFGVAGLMAVRLAAQVLSDFLLILRLRRARVAYAPDVGGFARLGGCLAASLCVGFFIPEAPGWGGLAAYAALTAGVFWAAALALRPLGRGDLRRLSALAGRGGRA